MRAFPCRNRYPSRAARARPGRSVSTARDIMSNVDHDAAATHFASQGTWSGSQAEATIVIFGASGDLTARKLLPALFRLAQGGFLSETSPIVGVARREKSDGEFRDEMFTAINRDGRSGAVSRSEWESFARRLFYRS